MGFISLGANIAALTAQRQLASSGDRLSAIFSRLSSGQRINRASDDSAGLAVSLSLDKDVRVYTQAIRNGNDAISALSIAEGSSDQLNDILVRLRELATQSANGSFSRGQRLSIDSENVALTNEFNRLVGSTTFNGLNILNGTYGSSGIQLGYGTDGQIAVGMGQGLSRNLGTGFTAALYAAGTGANSQQISVDINKDGKADVITTNTAGTIQVAIGNGDGTFVAPASYATVATAVSITSGDFNNDGNLDVAVGGNATGRVLLGNGDGTFQTAITLGSVSDDLHNSMSTADVNGDGIADIVSASSAAAVGVLVFLGQGNGQFGARTQVTMGGFNDVQVGDFNGDGRVDLAASSSTTNNLQIFNGSGNGTFSAATTYSLAALGGAALTKIAVGDTNYDGMSDLIVTSSTTTNLGVMLGTATGAFSAVTTVAIGAGTAATKLIDADGDGILDIVAVRSNTIQFLKGRGDGTFNAFIGTTGAGVTNSGSLCAADLNGDGVLDFSTVTSTGSACLYTATTSVSTTLQRMNMTSREGALESLATIDAALARVSRELGSIGSSQSRIFSALQTLAASRENSSAAAGRVMNADIASESANLVKEQILQQSGAAVLAQANQMPSLVLSLLRI